MSTDEHPALRILPMGEAALLVETRDITAVLALEARLADLVHGAQGVWASVGDLVPAARTILIVAEPGTDLVALGAAVRDVACTRAPDTSTLDAEGATVEIRVRYDGPDLDEVARLVRLTTAEVVAAHTGTRWRVAFGGFAPGFAYLVGGDPRLEVPRRPEPRARVAAGSVGLAGQFSGIYPRESPGGWQLLGTTDADLWSADREPPALLSPGTTVRFIDIGGR